MENAEPTTDGLLADVLADGVQSKSSSSLRNRLQSPEISQYLSHLTSLDLSEIAFEPSALASEAAQLTNSLTSLCYAEYPTFLELHRTSIELSSTLSSFSSTLAALKHSLPALDAQARTFAEQTRSIQDIRAKARRVLNQLDALADVLDIPQLIDTCVRNAYYQEAMDLSTHAARLAERFPNIRIVQDVATEAMHAMCLMTVQLLTLLREPVKLPTLFKAVTFLRKMGAFDEIELALTFLTSRLVILNSRIKNIETERLDHARYIRKYVDVWREGVYDVSIQYSTIFLERTEAPDELPYLLSTFTRHMLNALLDVLHVRLSKVEDATLLSALLTQLTHCANALARVGLDFTSLLQPIFEDAVCQRFANMVEEATDELLSTLSDAQKYNKRPSSVLCTPTAAFSPPEDTRAPDALHIPPTVLASYPLLATYTNALLAALNNLRLLAPISLLTALLSALDKAFERSTSLFLVYVQVSVDPLSPRTSRPFSEGEPVDQSRIMKAAGKIFTRLLVPYIRLALIKGVYGEEMNENFQVRGELKDNLREWDSWLNASNS